MRQNRGFTLVELVLFIVIVGVATAGIVVAFTQSTAHTHEPLIRQRTLAIANAYMDEILRKRWNENTPIEGGCVVTPSGMCGSVIPEAATLGADGTEDRAAYDDVDDYGSLAANHNPAGQGGAALANHAGYTVTVTVSEPEADWNGIARDDVRRIAVAVTNPLQETFTVVAYRVNF